MQQTTKYQFKLIEGSDDFSPQPLNDNVEKVEELLADLGSEAAEKGFVVGSYTGTGSPLTITLGFKPRFVIVTGQVAAGAGAYGVTSYTGFSGGAQISSLLVFEENGFTLTGHDEYPAINLSGVNYSYLAFR